jgi:hypothetical protein
MAGLVRRVLTISSGGLLLLSLVSACTQVVETIPFDSESTGTDPACRSPLGAYYLPRGLLRFSATKTDMTITGTLSTTVNLVPDRTQALCLDYLSLPTSRDVVTVQRDPATGLLTGLSSDVTDRTPQIINTLIATGENLAIAAGRTGTTGTPTTNETLDIEFDPFVYSELMAAKRAMQRFGFCLYVEGYSFPSASHSSGASLVAAQRWCSARYPPAYQNPSARFSSPPVAPEIMRTGVLYRPNMTQKIVLLQKADPDGPGPWLLYQTKRFEMPNVSPILSVGVQRAIFANRKTTLAFNNGVLTDVAIDKGSELAGFVQIPLAVAQAVVSVPGQIITFRLTDANNQAALLNAQSQLIQTVATFNQTVAGNAAAGNSPRSTDLRNGRMFGACVDAGGGESCGTLVQDFQLQR